MESTEYRESHCQVTRVAVCSPSHSYHLSLEPAFLAGSNSLMWQKGHTLTLWLCCLVCRDAQAVPRRGCCSDTSSHVSADSSLHHVPLLYDLYCPLPSTGIVPCPSLHPSNDLYIYYKFICLTPSQPGLISVLDSYTNSRLNR